MRVLPAWIASAGINAGLIALFTLLVGVETKAESVEDEIKAKASLVKEETKKFNFENIEIGDDPEREINFDMKRIEDFSVPGPEDPAEAFGIKDAPDTPPVNVPPPPGLDRGQGGAENVGPSGKLPTVGLAGGYASALKARPGGFGGRSGATRRQMVVEGGGNTESEAAVARGLKWLANYQCARPGDKANFGSWSLDKFPDYASMIPPYNRNATGTGRVSNNVAGTAFGLLPFLAAGMTHRSGDKYSKNVLAAAKYLIGKQDKKTGKFDGNMYAHGLAAIAMCELYGLSGDSTIKVSAQLGLNFIAYAQDPAGGGWRYAPRTPGDTSVVGWQVMALKSGQMAGLNVPKQTLTLSGQFLDSVEVKKGLDIERGPGNLTPSPRPAGQFGYTSPASRDTTNSVGLLCRQYLGAQRENPSLLNGVCWMEARGTTTRVENVYLNAVLPQLKTVNPAMVRQLKSAQNRMNARFPMKDHYGNMYFLYYATQIMHHMNGEFWEDWNLGIWVDPDGKQVRVSHLLRWDENGDGLTKEELMMGAEGDEELEKFLKSEWDRLERADKDKDGKLTQSELSDKDFVTWVPGMRDTLIGAQDKTPNSPHFGSWDPRGDRHSTQGGRVMKTSLCLLTLEVYYRHLPLYRREMAAGGK